MFCCVKYAKCPVFVVCKYIFVYISFLCTKRHGLLLFVYYTIDNRLKCFTRADSGNHSPFQQNVVKQILLVLTTPPLVGPISS